MSAGARSPVLVTGTAGFIGFHLARDLLADGHDVIGLDAFTPFYDEGLKAERHALLAAEQSFTGHVGRLEEPGLLTDLIARHRPRIIVHLAAQAGVRDADSHAETYVASNVVGTHALLRACEAHPPDHLLLASTSSVYGAGPSTPFREDDVSDECLSHYAATKKAMEVIAHAHAHRTGLPITALRFFTVYGPWGRPDMALFRFTKAVIAGDPVPVHGDGTMLRDFTAVADLVAAIRGLSARPPKIGEIGVAPNAPYRNVNIGGGRPRSVLDLVRAVEMAVGRPARIARKPVHAGEMPVTHASTERLERLIGSVPTTPLEEGVAAFVAWYRARYRV